MRTAVENWLLKRWYDGGEPPWYLRALEPVYRIGFRRSQNVRPIESQRELPLVVVGNITAGGSGKTPLVIRLCQLAQEAGFKPGVISKGYGRSGRDTIVVQAKSDSGLCGDEPVLLAQRTGVPVVVSVNRQDAIRRLTDLGVDLVLSDDGLQQPDLHRDIEICVVDGERGLGNGHLIPAGPLRESPERLARVDYVVSNGEWSAKPAGLEVSVMHLQASVVCALDGSNEFSMAEFRHQFKATPLQAVAAIGNPGRFFKMLESLGITAATQAFPDHHRFTREDFYSISIDSAIIMTEKDAVKCRSLDLQNAWYIPVETRLSGAFEDDFKRRITTLMKEST
jgi:tetraacyldisaccharide 4'-kinase